MARSKMVRGDLLPDHLKKQVLARYVHRWTHENASQTYGGKCPACEQAFRGGRDKYVCGEALPNGPKVYTRQQWHAYHAPLVTDEQWLKDHAFAVTAKGELSERQKYAEPAFMADGA